MHKSGVGAFAAGSDMPHNRKVQKSLKGHVKHIMISYDHKHKDQVHPLEAALRKLGYKTWIDKSGIFVGGHFARIFCFYRRK